MTAPTHRRYLRVLAVAILPLAGPVAALDGAYDPLRQLDPRRPESLDLTVVDVKRTRQIPLRVYLPWDQRPAPVVLFSHGLGGSREGCAYLGEHWARRGYLAVFLQHPGSDTSVWRGQPRGQRRAAREQAAGLADFMLRVQDVRAVLDQLERWQGSPGQPLAGRLDLGRTGMSGHSFGAVTTQAVSGQRVSVGGRSFTDERIKAALALSPSSPRRGDPGQAFGGVEIPWMLMTGTRDLAPIGQADLESRLAVFPALPPGAKYQLVLDGAEHSAFTERALPGDRAPRNPNHHRLILALSTAFWDAWLRADATAREWLDGSGPSALLEKGDRWQRK